MEGRQGWADMLGANWNERLGCPGQGLAEWKDTWVPCLKVVLILTPTFVICRTKEAAIPWLDLGPPGMVIAGPRGRTRMTVVHRADEPGQRRNRIGVEEGQKQSR